MTALAQLALFVSSYAPLFGVFALLGTFGHGWATWVCAALAVVGLTMPFVVLRAARRLAPQQVHANTVQIRDGDVLAYIATYIVPFAAMAGATARERAAIGLFVILIAILYIRSQLFYVNPILALAGYRIFQVVTPAGASVVLLSPRPFLRSGTCVTARRLGDYVHWEAKQ
ncbi:MAG: hypothetical protein ACRDYB_04745 [Acidimicrobiales bacterium]